MNDESKSKSQLIEELSVLRQNVTDLENVLTIRKQAGLEMEQMLSVEREQRQRTEMLNQIGIALTNSLNYETVLDAILEYIEPVVPHDAACLMLVDGTVVRAFRWRGYARFGVDPFAGRGFACHIDHSSILSEIRDTCRPMIITVDQADNCLYGKDQPWIKSQLGAPICVDDGVAGFVILDSATPGFFIDTHIAQLEAYIELVAIALKNAQLYTQTRQEVVDRVKALKKERNFADAVLDTAGALVMVLNPQGRILRFNRACENTTGYTVDEVRGQAFWDLFLTSDQVGLVRAIFDALCEDRSYNEYESYWYTKDRRKRMIAWSNTVLLDTDGEVKFIISSGVDITERRQLSDQLVAIHYMGRELNLLRDEESILEMTLETAAFLLEFKSAGYGVLNEVTGLLDYCYHPIRGVPKHIKLSLPMEVGVRIDTLIAECNEAVKGMDPAETLPVFSTVGQAHRAWLTMPMKIGERVIGVLDIEGHEPDQFTQNNRQLLQTLADQTAVAIENAQLHQEAQQRVDELGTLNMISQAITSTLNLEETLSVITDHALRLLDAMAASVVMLDEQKGDLWFHAASGRASDFVRGMRMAAGQGIAGWVIEHGEPALVADTTQDPRFFKDVDQQSGFSTHSIICVPLQTRKQTIGAIEVMNKHEGTFVQNDLRLLNWLATPAAIAIQNARLFEQIQEGHQRLQSLSRRLVEVQETERRHIARELHDEAGQSLTSLMVGLRLLEREADSSESVIKHVSELKKQTNDILESLHRLAIDLRPASLDHLGLVAALRQYIQKFSEQNDLSIQFEAVKLDDRRLPPDVETNLYRIVQEALTNVVRHAQATRVAVLLERRGDRLVTIIEDNGAGFDSGSGARRGRLGLVGMRERAQMLDGTLEIESSSGTGTTIYAEVPYVYSNTDS